MSIGSTRDLNQCVQAVRQEIRRLRKRNSPISEDDTKRVLINPLLQALGWDIFDVEEIRSEYRHKSQDNPVDYALFLLRTPALFLEAKALGKNLEDRKWVSQTIGYAATVGVEWCVLTNGDTYKLYNAHAAVDADEKLFRSVAITSEDDQPVTLETLSLLSKENMKEKLLDVHWKIDFVDKRVKGCLDELIAEPNPGLVRLLHKHTTGLSVKEIRASISRAMIQIDFPVLVAPANTKVDRKPSKPGGGIARKSKDLGVEIGDLIAAQIIQLPFRLQVIYKKREFTATILGENEIEFDGVKYTSVSTAAAMVRRLVNGPPTGGRKVWQTNGWTFWKYRDSSDGSLHPLSDLRDRLATRT